MYRKDQSARVARALFPGTQGGPQEDVLLAKLVGFEVLAGSNIRAYAESIIQNARAIAAVFGARGSRQPANANNRDPWAEKRAVAAQARDLYNEQLRENTLW